MITRLSLLVCLALVLSHCADKPDSSQAASEASQPRSMNERFNARGKEGYYQDTEGNWKIKDDKRSSFESVGRSPLENQQYSGKAYKPGTVEKPSWWGNTQYQKQSYLGNTSANQYQTTAADAGKSANESGAGSVFSSKSVTTRNINRTSALESNRSNAMQGADAAREAQRAYAQPDIIDWQEQRSLQLKDTKSWLNK